MSNLPILTILLVSGSLVSGYGGYESLNGTVKYGQERSALSTRTFGLSSRIINCLSTATSEGFQTVKLVVGKSIEDLRSSIKLITDVRSLNLKKLAEDIRKLASDLRKHLSEITKAIQDAISKVLQVCFKGN